MQYVRFKCPNCGEDFKMLKVFATSDTTRMCPKCGTRQVPMIPEDRDMLKLEEKDRCSGFG